MNTEASELCYWLDAIAGRLRECTYMPDQQLRKKWNAAVDALLTLDQEAGARYQKYTPPDPGEWVTDVRSYTPGAITREVRYANMDTERLREHCKRNAGPGEFNNYDRNMLLALMHNRNPAGYFVEILWDPSNE